MDKEKPLLATRHSNALAFTLPLRRLVHRREVLLQVAWMVLCLLRSCARVKLISQVVQVCFPFLLLPLPFTFLCEGESGWTHPSSREGVRGGCMQELLLGVRMEGRTVVLLLDVSGVSFDSDPVTAIDTSDTPGR